MAEGMDGDVQRDGIAAVGAALHHGVVHVVGDLGLQQGDWSRQAHRHAALTDGRPVIHLCSEISTPGSCIITAQQKNI